MGRERGCDEEILSRYKISISSSHTMVFSLEAVVVSTGINIAASERR